MKDGPLMSLPRSSSQGWLAAFTGKWDDDELAILEATGGPILDIGACFGLYSVRLAARDLKVIAVEPVPGNVAILRANCARNGISDRVRIIEVAVGSESGSIQIAVEGEARNGNAFVVADGGAQVRLCRLDELKIGPLSAMKLDVEGFEMEVLAGARDLIASQRPLILGEFHPIWFEARGVATDAVENWARANGYALSRCGRRGASTLLLPL